MNPEDRYFEKVILFLNPAARGDDYMIQKRADEYLQAIAPKIKRRRRLKPGWLFCFQMLASAAAGGIIVALIQLL